MAPRLSAPRVVFLSAVFFVTILFPRTAHSQIYPVEVFELGRKVVLEPQPTLKGGKIDLSAYRNKKIVVLAFWLHSCDLCIDQLKQLEKFVGKNNRSRDVAVITVSRGQKDEQPFLLETVKKRKIKYPVILDPETVVTRKFGVSMVPAFVIIDKQGRVAANGISSVDRPVRDMSLTEMIDSLIGGKKIPDAQFIEYAGDAMLRKMIGRPAPDFRLDSLDGRPYRLEEYRGGMNVLLVFWNPVYPTCNKVLLGLKSFYTVANRQKYNFVILTAASLYGPEQMDETKNFIETSAPDYPVLNDRDSKVGKLYRVKNIPTMFMIDRKGKVVEVIVGSPKNIEKHLEAFFRIMK